MHLQYFSTISIKLFGCGLFWNVCGLLLCRNCGNYGWNFELNGMSGTITSAMLLKQWMFNLVINELNYLERFRYSINDIIF